MELNNCEFSVTWYGVCSWIGTIILILRVMPQAFRSWVDGHSNGLSPAMLWLWLLGSSLVLPHLILLEDFSAGIVYFTNIFFVCIMLKYSYFPRKKE
jgi:uncharacterized protein with PQ loop repeat